MDKKLYKCTMLTQRCPQFEVTGFPLWLMLRLELGQWSTHERVHSQKPIVEPEHFLTVSLSQSSVNPGLLLSVKRTAHSAALYWSTPPHTATSAALVEMDMWTERWEMRREIKRNCRQKGVNAQVLRWGGEVMISGRKNWPAEVTEVTEWILWREKESGDPGGETEDEIASIQAHEFFWLYFQTYFNHIWTFLYFPGLCCDSTA